MAKRAIAIWWIVGTVVMFAGGSAALFVSFETKQGNFLHGHTGTSVALLVVSISIAAAGVILQLVAWTGALFNTHLLAGKTWFQVLLWVGVAGIVTSPIVLGGLVWWGLMLTYLVGGPDGTAPAPASLPADATRSQAAPAVHS
jgi:hypothetical protein